MSTRETEREPPSSAPPDPRNEDRSGASTTGESQSDGEERERPLLAFFIPDLGVGGAEQVTVNIVNGLAAREYDVELLLSRHEGELESQLSDRVKVVTLPPSRTSVLGVGAHLPAIASYVREREPAALIPHLTHPSVVCLAVNRLLDVDTEVVPTHHSAFGAAEERTAKDRVVDGLVTHLYPAADRIVAVSEGVADSVVEGTPVERSEISVLNNPVPIEEVRERSQQPVDHEWIEDDDVPVVLFVGRLVEQKDLETWLHAFRRIHERRPEVRGVIAGQGPLREDLQTLAGELGIGDAVSIPGYVDNPYRFMAQADAFLLSSRYEGLPTVLIEALACGCPIVSTDCPSGPREILADGTYGRLAPVGDVDGLADAVDATLADPTPAETLRDRGDDFSPEAVIDDYERFIETYVV